MARTYRRKRGDDHWLKWELRNLDRKEYRGLSPERAAKKARAAYHADGWWTMTTPSHWIRDMMTKPQRAETRRLLHVVRQLVDLEEAPLFPLAKKPHHYCF